MNDVNNVEFNNVKIFDQINKLNKQISKLQTEIRIEFFDNIDSKNLEGEIEEPFIYIGGRSDSQKLKFVISEIEKVIHRNEIEKLNFQYFHDTFFNTKIVKNALGKELTEREIQQKRNECISKLENDIVEYYKLIDRINSNPKLYLRYLELQSFDFSCVNNSKARKRLKEKSCILNKLLKQRDKLLKKVKKDEKKYALKNENYKN